MKISTKKKHINQCKLLLSTASQTTAFQLGHYLYLERKQNVKLFKLLDKLGFFKFHRTNTKKHLVAVHQVVLFLYKGWKYVSTGGQCLQGKLEIHHLNHNTLDNREENLWYVTPEENKAAADLTTLAMTNHKAGYYNQDIIFDLDKINLNRDLQLPFYKLLAITIKETANNLNEVIDFDFIRSALNCLPFRQAKLIANFI